MKNQYSIYYIFVETFEFCEIEILIHEIKNRNFDINVEKDFSHIKSKIRKENNHLYKSFNYYKYYTINYSFFFIFESNKFTIYASFSIHFTIRFKRIIKT